MASSLSAAQLANARAIAAAGRARNASRADIVIALMVALDESSLQNLANPGVPESMALPHDGVGSNADSVGLFQQRPSQGWGTVAELMNPNTAANKFFDALGHTPHGGAAKPWVTAQMVQKSADPSGSNYHAQYDAALSLADTVLGANPYAAQDPLPGQPGYKGIVPGYGKLPSLDWAGSLATIGNLVNDPAFWRRAGLFALGAVLILIAVWKILDDTGVVAAVGKGAVKAAEVAVL